MSNASLSVFPNAIDNFKRYSDLNAVTMEKAEIYKGYIEAGDYVAAAQYLEDNKDLGKCGISAEIINQHSDAIIALEENVKDLNGGRFIIGTSSSDTVPKNASNVSTLFLNYVVDDTVVSFVPIHSANNTINLSGSSNSITLDSSSDILTTSEKVIGKYNNKTLYQRIFNVSFNSNESEASIAIDDFIDIVDISGVVKSQVTHGTTGTQITYIETYPIGYSDSSIKVNVKYGYSINHNGAIVQGRQIIISTEGITPTEAEIILKYTK